MQNKFFNVLAVGAGLLVAVYLSGNFAVRKLIETKLSHTIGLKTSIMSLRISPFLNSVSMKKLTVANPSGFSDKPLFSLKSATMYIDVFTLSQQIIQIHSIKLKGISINAEHGANGFNLDHLKKGPLFVKNLKTHKEEGSSSGKNDGEKKKQLIILGRLKAKSIEVRVSSPSTGVKSIHFKLPDVFIDDVSGLEGTALTLDEILYKIMRTIIDNLAAQGPDNYQNIIRKFLTDQLQNFYKK